jgi:hypothetical protein
VSEPTPTEKQLEQVAEAQRILEKALREMDKLPDHPEAQLQLAERMVKDALDAIRGL